MMSLRAAAALCARWMSPDPGAPAPGGARPAGAMARSGASCGRWPGLGPGAAVPCRSKAVGRSLALKLPGSPRREVEIVACAVPRATVRPSKQCRPAFLARQVDGLFRGQLELVDGGKVRNATRTPRPTHPGMSVEWVSGKIVDGPKQRMRDNVDADRDALDDVDLPFPHRAGSSVCCPTSARSAHALSAEVREAYEVEGALSRPLAARVERLAEHLRARHRVTGLPARVGPEDFDGAFAVVSAGTAYCAKYLADWQDAAEVSAAERKVERKKASARKASQRRRDTKAMKTENSRAVKALLRAARRVT